MDSSQCSVSLVPCLHSPDIFAVVFSMLMEPSVVGNHFSVVVLTELVVAGTVVVGDGFVDVFVVVTIVVLVGATRSVIDAKPKGKQRNNIHPHSCPVT